MKFLYVICTTLFLLSCSDSKKESTVETDASMKNDESGIDFSALVDKDFIIDDQHSYIGFKINYFGFSPVRGRFNEFSGTVFYDPSHP